MGMDTVTRDFILSEFALEIARAAPAPLETSKPTTTVEITIPGDHKPLSSDQIREIEAAMAAATGASDIKVHRVTKGSLKLLIELPADAVDRLRAFLASGPLRTSGAEITTEGLSVDLFTFRGHPVLLDETLALFFERPVKQINQARDRHADRFDDSYAFQLSDAEWLDLRSQIVTTKTGRGGRRTAPWVYTEKGAAMLATVLRTPRAVAASKLIIETFVAARRNAAPVPPQNHDGLGDPALENADKAAFKARLRDFDA